MITREFNLYIHAGHSIPLVINVNQYDQGEQWLFTLFNADGTQYTPSSGAIVGIKSDNLGIINSGTVDSQGRVVINETQQMTAAVGKAVFELLIDDQTHGTANFIVLVEPKPGDNADLSESDYSLFQQAIDGTSATAIAQGVADWMDENLTPTTPVVDASLTVQGAAADSAKVGQELSDLKSQLNNAMPVAVKLALDNMLAHVPFNDWDASSDYATFHAWASEVTLLSISAVFTQGDNVIYTHDSLNSLKQYLTVTAHFDDGTDMVVTSYELSGTLTAGTSTITVTYGGKSTTFNVTVTQGIPNTYTKVSYISAPQIGTVLNGSTAQYIDLPYTADSSKTYKLETAMRWDGTWGSESLQLFAFNSFGYFGKQISSGNYAIDTISASGSDTGISASSIDFDEITCELKPNTGNTLTVNGTSANSSRSSWTAGRTLCLFAMEPSNNVPVYPCKASMKYFRLYIDGTLTMNLLPCYRNSDDVAGLYDIIGGAFYPSDGADAFTYEA